MGAARTDRRADPALRHPAAAVILWLLAFACMGLIFWFSSRNADESNAESGFFVELFGVAAVYIRKAAHFLEFSALGFFLHSALLTTCGRRLPLPALAIAALYAVSDEIHQIFVEGRACRLFDMGVDTAGAACGIAASLLLFLCIICFKERRAVS